MYLNTWKELPNLPMSKTDYKKRIYVWEAQISPTVSGRGGLGMVQSSRGGQEPTVGPGAGEELGWWKVAPLFSVSLFNGMWHWHKDRCWICLSDAERSGERDPLILNVQACTCSSTLSLILRDVINLFQIGRMVNIICLSITKFP